MRPEEFDKIIKDAAGTGQFDFNEADWKDAHEKIAPQTSSRKWGLLLILLLPLGIWYALSHEKQLNTVPHELNPVVSNDIPMAISERTEFESNAADVIGQNASKERPKANEFKISKSQITNKTTAVNFQTKLDEDKALITPDQKSSDAITLHPNKESVTESQSDFVQTGKDRSTYYTDGVASHSFKLHLTKPEVTFDVPGQKSLYKRWAVSLNVSQQKAASTSLHQWQTSAGLSILRYFKNGLYLGATPQFTLQYGYDDISKIERQVNYGIEAQELYYGVKPQVVSSVGAPVYIGLVLDQFRFDVGYAFDFLLTGYGAIHRLEYNDAQINILDKLATGRLDQSHSSSMIHGPVTSINYRLSARHEIGLTGTLRWQQFFTAGSFIAPANPSYRFGVTYNFYIL